MSGEPGSLRLRMVEVIKLNERGGKRAMGPTRKSETSNEFSGYPNDFNHSSDELSLGLNERGGKAGKHSESAGTSIVFHNYVALCDAGCEDLLEARPSLYAWFGRCRARPTWQAAVANVKHYVESPMWSNERVGYTSLSRPYR
eukprot:scaffold14078_cov58-Phaeocystis_antarctica.AAC.2